MCNNDIYLNKFVVYYITSNLVSLYICVLRQLLLSLHVVNKFFIAILGYLLPSFCLS